MILQERIEALSHQNTELKVNSPDISIKIVLIPFFSGYSFGPRLSILKKRVVWNLGTDMNDRKTRLDNGNEIEQRPNSSSENGLWSQFIFTYIIFSSF
jgi:hypothetical protein